MTDETEFEQEPLDMEASPELDGEDVEDSEGPADEGGLGDDGFNDYLAEYEKRQAAVEKEVADATKAEPEAVKDFGEMPQDEWDRLQLERSDATEDEKVALFRQQAEEAKAAAEKSRQDAEMQAFVDLMREASEASKAKLHPFLPQEPEEVEQEAGDLTGVSEERVIEVAKLRMLEDKSYYELKQMGIDPLELEQIDAPLRPDPEYPTTEYTEMSDAQFKALLAKRDLERTGR